MSSLRERVEGLVEEWRGYADVMAIRSRTQPDVIEHPRKEVIQSWADAKCAAFRLCADALADALVAEGQGDATVDELKARLKEARSEFAILSRACGNWREWPESTVSTGIPDWTHDDWKAATRAIMERDELRDVVEYDRDKLWCDVLFNANAKEWEPKVFCTPEAGRKILDNLLATAAAPSLHKDGFK